MALALGLLLGDQLAARRDDAVLRGVLQRVGTDRLCRRARDAAAAVAALRAASPLVNPSSQRFCWSVNSVMVA